jgi:precorrin-2/cobalt-factor-2 C20-methyltransferase
MTDTPATLYGIGVGPGDPELLTVKAARLIGELDVIAAPIAHLGRESAALATARHLLRPAQTILRLHFPMAPDAALRHQHRQAAARQIAAELEHGRRVGFLSEGDPLLYSTFGHLLAQLDHAWPVTVVPGVSSITAAAAEARLPLVFEGQRLAIVPAAHTSDDELLPILEMFDTVILLKIDRVLDRLLALLQRADRLAGAYLVERASQSEGRVIRDVLASRDQRLHYMSLLVVQRGGGEHEG